MNDAMKMSVEINREGIYTIKSNLSDRNIALPNVRVSIGESVFHAFVRTFNINYKAFWDFQNYTPLLKSWIMKRIWLHERYYWQVILGTVRPKRYDEIRFFHSRYIPGRIPFDVENVSKPLSTFASCQAADSRYVRSYCARSFRSRSS